MKLKNILINQGKKVIPQAIWNPISEKRTLKFLKNAELVKKSIGRVNQFWRNRIDTAISSPDNKDIKRVENAGEIESYFIYMHNGVKVCANGYYGDGILNLLIENKGVHEPQEEKAFDEIIKLLPEYCTMLELGAYWGFYSLSLLEEKPNARCYLVEPEIENITSGKTNFKLNNRIGNFTQAYAGSTSSNKPRTIAVDSFCNDKKINHLDILHSDIQGYEAEMLKGASKMLSTKRISYIFLSTHSEELHSSCSKTLKSYGYEILASANITESFSYDGLIVAKSPEVALPTSIIISHRNNNQ